VGDSYDLLAQELETGDSGALASLVGVEMSERCPYIFVYTGNQCQLAKGHAGTGHWYPSPESHAEMNQLWRMEQVLDTLQLQVTDLHSKVDALAKRGTCLQSLRKIDDVIVPTLESLENRLMEAHNNHASLVGMVEKVMERTAALEYVGRALDALNKEMQIEHKEIRKQLSERPSLQVNFGLDKQGEVK
jgi:hypothetical protein